MQYNCILVFYTQISDNKCLSFVLDNNYAKYYVYYYAV